MRATWARHGRSSRESTRISTSCAYTLTGVRFGLENADNRWGVYLFVNNLLNVTGFIGKSGGASTGGVNDVQAVTVMPRTIGVSFRAKLH